MAALAEILAGLDPETAGAVASSNAMQPAVDAHFQGLAQQLADWGQQQDAMKQRLAGQPLSQQVLDPEALQSAASIALSTGPGAIRAYHGSPFDFDAFDASKIGSTTDPGALGRALYFSTDPRVAESGQHRYEVNLNVANPVSLAKSEWGIPGNGMAEKRQLVTRALDLPADASPEQISQAAMQRGHDSVSLDYSPLGYKHQEIAVFDPKLIDIVRKYGLAGLMASGAAASGLPDQK